MSDLTIALIVVAALAFLSAGVWLARILMEKGKGDEAGKQAQASARANAQAEVADEVGDAVGADLRESLRVRGAHDLLAEDATDE